MSLATPQMVKGDRTKIKSGTFEFPGTKWSMTVKAMTKDMSNMRDGRNRQPGLPDAEGTFDLAYDVANDPTVVANGNLRHGSILDVKFCLTEAEDSPYYGVKIIVDELTTSADFGSNDAAPLTVKWLLQSGDVTYPTYGS